ncbi:hypothetical protein C1645_833465, partial [Glomus cerebriforme]
MLLTIIFNDLLYLQNKESVGLAKKQAKTISREVDDDDPFINNNRAEGSIHSKDTPPSSGSQSLEILIGIESAGSSRGPMTSSTNEVNNASHDRPVTPPHQIVRNTYNQEILINENILIMFTKNLVSLDKFKVFDDVILTNFCDTYRKYSIVCIEQYFSEFIPLFIKYKESEKNNAFFCANDDIIDIRGKSEFAKFLSIDQFIKLLSKKPSREVKLLEDWRNIIEEYYKEATESGLKKSISDWIRTTKELNVVKKNDTEKMTKLNMEVPILASKYRKNYGYNHAIDKVVDGKYADLLARIWRTGEKVFVGEQAGPPSQPNLIKLAMDSFKLYREMRNCLNIIIKNEVENTVTREYNSDTIQILKRKFNELVQTKTSPTNSQRNELFGSAPEGKWGKKGRMNSSVQLLKERTLQLSFWRNELFGSISGERTFWLNSWRTNTLAQLLEEQTLRLSFWRNKLFSSAPGGSVIHGHCLQHFAWTTMSMSTIYCPFINLENKTELEDLDDKGNRSDDESGDEFNFQDWIEMLEREKNSEFEFDEEIDE